MAVFHSTETPDTLCSRALGERIERETLASYACLASESTGRQNDEPHDPYRTAFQRDRDRIVHCAAFRRLEYKTQVFLYSEGDHFRTRLTHTLEVSQVARSLARMLRLNQDLVEAVALSHDLGHTPFGHAGERALDRMMREHGGFEHNEQTLRVVDTLEERTNRYPGLNLTAETREGIRKHETSYDRPSTAGGEARWPHLEGQIVDIADELAYNNHDIDDGLFSRLLDLEEIMDALPRWREVYEHQVQRLPGAAPRVLQRATVSAMINRQILDVATSTADRIRQYAVNTVDLARHAKQRIVGFSDEMAEYNRAVKHFLFPKLYRHHLVMGEMSKCERMVEDLFGLLVEKPNLLRPRFHARLESGESVHRVVADYIAGMTDRFAIDEYQRLFIPDISFHSKR